MSPPKNRSAVFVSNSQKCRHQTGLTASIYIYIYLSLLKELKQNCEHPAKIVDKLFGWPRLQKWCESWVKLLDCAEIIAELIPERVGPVINNSFFTGINNFQTDSSNLSCKKSKAWKLLETIINSKQLFLHAPSSRLFFSQRTLRLASVSVGLASV